VPQKSPIYRPVTTVTTCHHYFGKHKETFSKVSGTTLPVVTLVPV
jgi:hypothetical protein